MQRLQLPKQVQAPSNSCVALPLQGVLPSRQLQLQQLHLSYVGGLDEHSCRLGHWILHKHMTGVKGEGILMTWSKTVSIFRLYGDCLCYSRTAQQAM